MRWLPKEPVIGLKTAVFLSCNTTSLNARIRSMTGSCGQVVGDVVVACVAVASSNNCCAVMLHHEASHVGQDRGRVQHLVKVGNHQSYHYCPNNSIAMFVTVQPHVRILVIVLCVLSRSLHQCRVIIHSRPTHLWTTSLVIGVHAQGKKPVSQQIGVHRVTAN
jgi:hypothetical protein